jgi:hypothetical protein
VGNLPSWEDLELQADRVADEIFSGVESSLMSVSDMDLDELPPEPSEKEEEITEEAAAGGRLKQMSRGEWLLLGTALSSVTLAGTLWWTQISPTMSAKAQEAPPPQASSVEAPMAAIAPAPTNQVTTEEEKILQRYKQDLQATKTALGTKAGNKANPFFPSVKTSPSSNAGFALPPASQQPFQVAKGQTPTVLTQSVVQAPQPQVQVKVQTAQPVAAVPQRYNIPPLPRILPAPPSLRPLKANGGSLPPLPPPIQVQKANPSPSPVNVQTAASTAQAAPAPANPSTAEAQAPANAPQVKPQPQTVASAPLTHSLVGIMGTGSKRQTALIKSGESVREVLAGEQLGGGWTLQAIAENQVTLQQQGGQTKVLTLGDP